jgi:membrane protein implicated in regulation of membrane protease activity
VVLVTAAFFVIGVWLSLKTLHKKPFSGDKGLLGQEGDARTLINKDGGSAFINGAHWNAWSDTEISQGAKVVVVGVKGMKLKVEPFKPA